MDSAYTCSDYCVVPVTCFCTCLLILFCLFLKKKSLTAVCAALGSGSETLTQLGTCTFKGGETIWWEKQ